MDIKYLALLTVSVANVFMTVVVEVATVVVPSTRSELFNVAPAVANDNVPEPSVLRNWLAVPSDVGKLRPLIVTVPELFADSSRLAFEELVFMVLSSIVIPSSVSALVRVSVVTVSYTHLTLPTKRIV